MTDRLLFPEGYLRGLRSRNLNPSADALATCASKLGYYALHLSKSSKAEQREWGKLFHELRGLFQQPTRPQMPRRVESACPARRYLRRSNQMAPKLGRLDSLLDLEYRHA